MGWFAGKRPDSLGVTTGRLAPCRSTPNCVCSQGDPGDAQHHIAALSFKGDPVRAWAALERIVRAAPRAAVVRAEQGYLYAEFSSRLLGYVDDVEFVLDAPSGVIHLRSASRLGSSDFGVNRERMEALRQEFSAAGA